MQGKVVALEGLNGCGKSTTAEALYKIMRDEGHDVVLHRDPGDSPSGDAIRKIVKDPSIEMRPLTQMLLYTAARSELAHELAPWVRGGGHVVLDRWWPSTFAYQGSAGVDEELIVHLVEATTPEEFRIMPKLTFFLDHPVEVCMARSGALKPGGAEAGGDRFEAKGAEFQDKVRQAYMQLVYMGLVRHLTHLPLSPQETAEFIYRTYVQQELPCAKR